MGAFLGAVPANIIMTKLEKEIVGDLLNKGIIRFYCRYVDDTLILMKPNDIQQVLDKFNSFHKQDPSFPRPWNPPDGKSIYSKETQTGQYTNFESYTTWNNKIAWLRSLVIY